MEPKLHAHRTAKVGTVGSSSGGLPARLLIVYDHAIVRHGLRMMLAGEPDLEVVGEVANGREAVEACRILKPDLVLMDVRMPEMDGLEATRTIKGASPGTSILMVTTHQEPDSLLAAVRAGVAGYVLKESTKQELVDAVRKVLGGEAAFDQRITTRLILSLSEESARTGAHDPAQTTGRPEGRSETSHQGLAGRLPELLSNREIEALRLIAVGKTNRQIADDLMVSVSTVKTYVERILKKLGVSDRTQASVRAIGMGLLTDPGR